MNCRASLARQMWCTFSTLCIMLHALNTDLITMLILPSIWSCMSVLVFLTTNHYGVSRWHNDCSMSVTDGKNMLEMAWKWEERLCHRQPQWSRPQGIQIGSTWTGLTAQLEANRREGEGELKDTVVWTEGRCVRVYLCIHQCPLKVQFTHINEKLELCGVH